MRRDLLPAPRAKRRVPACLQEGEVAEESMTWEACSLSTYVSSYVEPAEGCSAKSLPGTVERLGCFTAVRSKRCDVCRSTHDESGRA